MFVSANLPPCNGAACLDGICFDPIFGPNCTQCEFTMFRGCNLETTLL